MTDAGWGEDCDSASGILREWRVLGHEQDSIPEASILVTGLCLAPATPHLPDPQADLPVWPIALNQASLTVRPLVGMTHFTKQPVMQVIQTADMCMLRSQKVPWRTCEGQRTNLGASHTVYLV